MNQVLIFISSCVRWQKRDHRVCGVSVIHRSQYHPIHNTDLTTDQQSTHPRVTCTDNALTWSEHLVEKARKVWGLAALRRLPILDKILSFLVLLWLLNEVRHKKFTIAGPHSLKLVYKINKCMFYYRNILCWDGHWETLKNLHQKITN